MNRRIFASLAGVALLSMGPVAAISARADAALDRIFDTTQLESIETGAAVSFDHRRITNGLEAVEDIENGRIVLAIETREDGMRNGVVQMGEGERLRTVGQFPGDAGNPLVMVFLESVLRTVAKGTGGSAFYLRNRIKDAFRNGTEVAETRVDASGDEIAAERIVYRPFENEANKARLGVFADLELAFLMSDDVPGGLVAATAVAGGGEKTGFAERIVLSGAKEVQ